MTNNNDEERMIADQLEGEEALLKSLVIQKNNIAEAIEIQKKKIEELKQAALDYMQGNGLIDSEHFRISKSERVIVDDVDALPDDYVRIKREPDKAKIKANRPDANSCSIQENINIVRK